MRGTMSVPLFRSEPGLPGLAEGDLVDYLKSYLAGTLAAVREEQRTGTAGGNVACHTLADAMDNVLRALHDRAREKYLASSSDLNYRMAVIAVGGYGRQELCPKSDIDLLFLHSYKSDPYVEGVTERILYPLWDLGLDVGYSVRNLKETFKMAAADDSIRTALMDFRFVAGQEGFFRESAGEIEKFLFFSGADRFIGKKLDEMRKRHAKYGETVYVLEPNVKEGKGGLRDLHSALWVARVKYKCRNLNELRNKGVVGEKIVRAIGHAQDYLLRVRNELHFLAGKKTDVLSFEVQDPMAEVFRYRDRGRNLAVERFMRTYYMNAAITVGLADELLEQVDRHLMEGFRKPLYSLQKKKVGGVGVLYKGKLSTLAGVSFQKEPLRILEFFRAMQNTRAVPTAQAKQGIQRALSSLGPEFLWDPRAANLFLSILSDPHYLHETLLAMHECRVLGRFIPEFASLSFLVQRDIYHVYTVDIHLILAASILPGLAGIRRRTSEEEAFLAIYRSIPRKDLLALAILCHDIGKGKGHGHSSIGAQIIARIGKRMGLTQDEIDDLVFLVEHHLLMAHVSQRRDMHDIELIIRFCETVDTPARLDMLYLLTYADMRAVGPEVWTQWKAMLLLELYDKAKNVLETGRLKRPFTERPRQRREQVAEMLLPFPPAAVSEYLSRFDDRYFLGTPDDRFADHLRILSSYDGATPRVETFDSPQLGTSELIVVCPDQHGLFSKIAGTISANGINILNATIATSVDRVALDTFFVTYMGKSLKDNPKKERVAVDLSAVLLGEIDVGELIAERKVARFSREKVAKFRPTHVVFDNSVSSRFTVVDIFTYDRIGLLYDITRTLAVLGLDIVLSKISTKADQVADVFYLMDRDGKKIVHPERVEEIRQALLEAIGD
ncbi:MAG: [protein-PII] uridylyltransferase [Candidatus Deferrimicrobiaceae bacterium]